MTERSSASPRIDPCDVNVLSASDRHGAAAPPGARLRAVDGDSGFAAASEIGVDRRPAVQSVDADERDVELLHLRRRLETLPVIEQSKGILISHYGIDADAAFDLLRQWACDNNVKLRDVSQQIVTAASASNEPRPSLQRFMLDLRSTRANTL